MNDIRIPGNQEVQYRLATPGLSTSTICYRWCQEVTDALDGDIIKLMRDTTAGAPIIGFGKSIDDSEAIAYIAELRDNLRAGKCRLLTIHADDGQLIGLCTLKRNLNPNNRHITDLAKGMIDERYRGGAVLPAAFYEIAAQCELDGVDLVTLDVRADTPAHRAWVRFGFESYGMLPDYARAGGQVFAGHFMMQPVSKLKERAAGVLRAQADVAQVAHG